jgi:hypothetical protein
MSYIGGDLPDIDAATSRKPPPGLFDFGPGLDGRRRGPAARRVSASVSQIMVEALGTAEMGRRAVFSHPSVVKPAAKEVGGTLFVPVLPNDVNS